MVKILIFVHNTVTCQNKNIYNLGIRRRRHRRRRHRRRRGHVIIVVAAAVVSSPSLPLSCHRRRCRRVVIVVVTTVVVVIASSLHRGHGRTMVGKAASPSARRLEARRARGAAKEGYKREKKLLVRNPVHARPRVSALSSCCGRHCRWTMAGLWRERTGTSVSKDRALDGDGDRALVGKKGRGR